MKKTQIRNSLLLLLTAVIWGIAFVAQSAGMDYVGPLTFLCVRSLIGGAALLPVIWFLERQKSDAQKQEDRTSEKRRLLIKGGILCGLALCFASTFQQYGIQFTTVGKAGFITACYIILVPIAGLFFGKRCGLNIWIGVLLAVGGLYCLCITETLRIGKGDILVLICAFIFSAHILVVDHFSPLVDGVKMACIQFFVCGLVSGAGMLLLEHPAVSDILMAWQSILYAGFLSSGVGYTLQIVGQKGLNPTVASLILSLESVVSVLAGLLILHQTLSSREVLGCVLMFAAIVLAQLPGKEKA
ncbi:DMT family transporter [Candidatus Merdisoma sp. HCP28S3_D10]|uniref:DMT family transporter n=1 Tax=unclassified Candidatus Merdisoma TaxID=3099611 RepID=UPI003F8BB895